jgi:AraC-like DNA-binding protein
LVATDRGASDIVGGMTGTASRITVQAALDALRRGGIDPAPVVTASGLTQGLLESIDARFPFENAQALWDHAAAAAADPSFGLHVALALPDGYGVLDYLLCTSPTLRQGYERLSQYIRIGYDQSDLRVHAEPPTLRLTRSLGACSPHYSQFLFGVLLTRGRRSTGVDWTPRRAAFMHAAPRDRAALDGVFRCALSFDAAQTELVLDDAVGELALVKADSPLQTLLMEYGQRLLAQLPARSDLEERVRAAVLQEMPDRLPRLESVGRQLRLPARTLQRRLKEAGLSFVRIRDEMRQQLALRYVSDASLSIGEIAFLLHFSEVAAFDRAFKRWTGVTPSAHRATLWQKPLVR